jgi:hypothetical protein
MTTARHPDSEPKEPSSPSEEALLGYAIDRIPAAPLDPSMHPEREQISRAAHGLELRDGEDLAKEQGHPGPYSPSVVSQPSQPARQRAHNYRTPRQGRVNDDVDRPLSPTEQEVIRRNMSEDDRTTLLLGVAGAKAALQASTNQYEQGRPERLKQGKKPDDHELALNENPFYKLLSLPITLEEGLELLPEDLEGTSDADLESARPENVVLIMAAKRNYSKTEIDGVVFTGEDFKKIISSPRSYANSLKKRIERELGEESQLTDREIGILAREKIVEDLSNRSEGMQGLLDTIESQKRKFTGIGFLLPGTEKAKESYARLGEDEAKKLIVDLYLGFATLLQLAGERAGWEQEDPGRTVRAQKALALSLFTGTDSEKEQAWRGWVRAGRTSAGGRGEVISKRLDKLQKILQAV